MEEGKTMGLNEALRIIMDKVGSVRVPVREKEIIAELDGIANDLYECILAIENARKQEEPEMEITASVVDENGRPVDEPEPEVSEDV